MNKQDKIKESRHREQKRKDTEGSEKIEGSDPYFAKELSFYEEMEWYLSGNFTTIRNITDKLKTTQYE
jgi:hypothetical protein